MNGYFLAFAAANHLLELNHAGKYPMPAISYSFIRARFFLPSPRSIPPSSHTWRLQNVRLDDVGSVHDRGRRRQIAQVVDRLLEKEWESSFILMPHLELLQGIHVVGWIPHGQ